MAGPLPVTVFSGSQGTDGSRVFERILQAPDEIRVMAIVGRRGKKRKGVAQNVSLLPTTERLVRLGQGCSCCTVRGDLMAKVKRLADAQQTDHILIHAAPLSDLNTLAKTFTVPSESGALLSDVANIETIVIVVDGRGFFKSLKSKSARALVERIELATVIVIEGGAVLAVEDYERVFAAISALNPEARIERADDESFGLEVLREAAVSGLDAPQASSVVRFSYQERRPFHPTRLHDFLGGSLDGILRIQGSFWVASQPDAVGDMNVAGSSRSTTLGGRWWASVPEAQRPQTADFKQHYESVRHPEFGDRVQDLNFAGIGIDEKALVSRLEQCLLTAEELADREGWKSMPHPFDWPKG